MGRTLRGLAAAILGRHDDAPPSGTTHVIQYCSPFLLAPADRDGGAGWWEIQTLANHEAGTPADYSPGLDGPAEMDLMDLCSFVEQALGCTVTFARFYQEVMLTEDYPHGTWLPAPGYYITPGA